MPDSVPTLSSVVMPVTLAIDRFSNEFKSGRTYNCWGGHSAVLRSHVAHHAMNSAMPRISNAATLYGGS